MSDLHLLIILLVIIFAYLFGYFLGTLGKINALVREIRELRMYMPTLNTSLRYILTAERIRNKLGRKANKNGEAMLKLNKRTVRLHEQAVKRTKEVKSEYKMDLRYLMKNEK